VQQLVHIPGESHDQRARRTRDALASALLELLREKGYDDITVPEIAAKANVGRSTFYAHFADKEDLIVQQSVAFNQMAGTHLTWDEESGAFRFPVHHLFEHVKDFRFLYDAFAKSRHLDRILKIGQIALSETFKKRIEECPTRGSDVPSAVLAECYAVTIKGLLVWWMDHHYPYSADEMDAYFHRLVGNRSRPTTRV
jgi:AcrR family transcriptional regulator